jgi:KDO2-lipid IV(A) lauroyltransferase
MSARTRLRHWVEYLAFRTAVCVVQAFPPTWLAAAADAVADFAFFVLPRNWTRYQVARDQLVASFPDRFRTAEQIDACLHAMWRHLFRLVGEMLHLHRKLRRDNVAEAVRFRGRPSAVRSLLSGRPVIVLSGHYGNWELAVAMFGVLGFRMGLVARNLDNPLLDRWMRRMRRGTGHLFISKRGAAEPMTRLLAAGGCVAVLADQDAGSGGVFVDFFGRPASTHKSIALLALEYDALVCVGYARRLDNQRLGNGWPRYEYGCMQVLDSREFTQASAVKELTQAYTRALELCVSLAPEQYFWVHRRWKTAPKVRRRGTDAIPSKAAG